MPEYSTYEFARLRHIGPSLAEMDEMLAAIGAASLDGLIDETIPKDFRAKSALEWGRALSEHDLLDEMREIAHKNRVMTSFIGQGYYGTFTPSVILRNILENPAWYTSYTPYQPEISQGRLEALLNYQTMVSDLTGLPVANASLLDEATAAAEAMTLAKRSAKSKANTFFVDKNLHPQSITVIKTRAKPLEIDVVVDDPETMNADEVFGAIFQYPGTDGAVRDFTDVIARLHEAKAVAVVAADLLMLTLLKTPGDMGADIAIGSSQRFGVPMGFGGPHAAYMAVKDELKRSMPGRIIGVSVDAKGRKAYRLSLQTREQHIRREKATSNICTAQALLAITAGFYAVFHGPIGLRNIAENAHKKAVFVANNLRANGVKLVEQPFFDTVVVDAGREEENILAKARASGMNLRGYGDGRVGFSMDETVSDEMLEKLLLVFGVKAEGDWHSADVEIDAPMRRTSDYLTHPVFNQNRAETEIMRYMRKLADRDLALDRTMIPLGSCTMKLNSASEMMSITWPEFANIHPYAPRDQVEGYYELIENLSSMLCDITGYDAMSMQPNSGAQGEYAGLLAIRNYHHANGDDARDICLIPISAHGTNPASAQMAGMKVVVVKSAENGDIDVDDFREKAKAAGDKLAACMITYPSTHGVFEETVREICDITHEFGGQVYIDGANMNAMVGLVRPGDLGGDVSHLNLHKTFCIPHGGGGPGMGPIGVKAHLAPFVSDDPVNPHENGAVSAANFGSPMILPISYSYCKLMGGEGLTKATKVAILSANYIAQRLSKGYDILFKGKNGRVAHECIIDTRPFADLGVTVDDIAKRLIDFGFHAPTMSWPVAGTLMIEPTESECKEELDRFCDAMLAIREEIAEVERGEVAVERTALHNAPHTLDDIIGDWDRAYSRLTAVVSTSGRMDKYFPPVNRVDNVFGDRNLVCTCPPHDAYLDAAE